MLSRIQWETLDATADDAESLEQIFLMLCIGEQDKPLLSEVADAIYSLTQQGLLRVRFETGTEVPNVGDASYVWRGWFDMTPAGKEQWQEQEGRFAD